MLEVGLVHFIPVFVSCVMVALDASCFRLKWFVEDCHELTVSDGLVTWSCRWAREVISRCRIGAHDEGHTEDWVVGRLRTIEAVESSRISSLVIIMV